MRRARANAVYVAVAIFCIGSVTPWALSRLRAQAGEEPEAAAELASPADAPAESSEEPTFAQRLAALQLEQQTIAEGWLRQAERAHRRAASHREAGKVEAAERAERIAEAALELARRLIRRERLRARVQRLESDRRQVAAAFERAEAALEHLRTVPDQVPTDPNAPETEATESSE